MSNRKHLRHSAEEPIALGDIILASDRTGTYRVERIDECNCVFYGTETHLNIVCGKVNHDTLQPLNDGQFYFQGYRYYEQGLFHSRLDGQMSCRNSQIHIIVRRDPQETAPVEETLALGGLFS